MQYDARGITERGYASQIQTHPARYVAVRVLDVTGHVLAEGSTDARGQFTLPRPPGAMALTVTSAIHLPSECTPSPANTAPAANPAPCRPRMDLDVTEDPMGRVPYVLTTPLAPPGSITAPVTVHARLDTPRQEGGAFHILDTLVRGILAVHAWTGRELSPFFTIWQHEGPSDWSYYRGERPVGSGRYALELMGGERGRSAVTDADEHDESIILHEFGHFIFDQLSTSSSIGGSHPATVLTDPGVAWEEGRATWFAAAVMDTPWYRDAVGIEPQGQLRQNDHLEQLAANALRGLGSQRSVEEILWDLADGASYSPDADHDPIALGPAALMRAMISMRDVPGAYPSIVSFLRHLVAQGSVTDAQVRGLLESPQRHGIRLPAPNEPDLWPRDLAPDREAFGKIDGRTNPAPSGGAAHPLNGFDAVHAYRVTVPARARLDVQLAIVGSGRPNDGTDLDLQLRDLRSDLITESAGVAQTETLSRVVPQGTYVLYVRDGGRGNLADYRLRYTLTPQ